MSDNSYLLDGNDRKEKTGSRWLGRILKLLFIIIAFILVILTILANMGGSNDMLKEGVGQTIQRAFGGRPVTMKKLVHMGFFPTVALDVEDVLIFDKPEDSFPIMRFKKFQAYMPFWNVATSSPRLTSLYLEGFETIRGVFLPAAISVDRIYIDHDIDEGVAKLRGSGKVGAHSWNFSLGMEVTGSKGKYQYMILSEADLIFNIADIHFNGLFLRRGAKYYKFKDFNIEYENQKISGDLVLSALGDRLIKIKSDIKTKNDKTNLKTDLVVKFIDNKNIDISGKVDADKLSVDNFIGDNTVFSILSRLYDVAGYNDIPDKDQKDEKNYLLGQNVIDIDFNLNNVVMADKNIENLKFDIDKNGNESIMLSSILTQKNMLMPAIMLLNRKDENKVISIIQDGIIDIDFAKLWFKNIDKDLLNKDSINVECGMAEFSKTDNGMRIDSFAIDANPYNIGVKDKIIDKDNSIFDLHFIKNDNPQNFEMIDLPAGIFNFIQESFKRSNNTFSCSNYISMIKEDKIKSQPKEEENVKGNLAE